MKKHTISDPDYGDLVFYDYGELKYYSGRIKLSIAKKPIDIFFDSASQDRLPTQQQKRFLGDIINNFDEIIERLPAFLPPGNKLSQDLKYDLELLAFNIPDLDNENYKWDMTFKIDSLKNQFLIVYLENLMPISSYIEKDETKWWLRLFIRFFNRN